jgi:hypothetical protein
VTWRWGDVETELKQNKSSKQRKIFRPLSDVDWRERERKKVATARIGGVKVNTWTAATERVATARIGGVKVNTWTAATETFKSRHLSAH